jgi:hypothetical protein
LLSVFFSEDTKNKVIIGTKGVKYGLQRTNFSKTSVFGDDDDDNENEKIEGPIDFKKKVFEEAAKPNRQLKVFKSYKPILKKYLDYSFFSC